MTDTGWRLYREKLLFLREKLGISQQTASGRCQCTERHYQRLEHGETLHPRRATMEKLCEVVGLTNVSELQVSIDMPIDDEYMQAYEAARSETSAIRRAALFGAVEEAKARIVDQRRDAVVAARKLLSELAERKGAFQLLRLSLVGGERSLQIGGSLRVQVQSSISGWLTLIAVARDFSAYLVPNDGKRPFMQVVEGKKHRLPDEYDGVASWPIQGSGGDHILLGVVARKHRVIVLPNIPNLALRNDRGIGVELATLWGVPTNDLAVGCLEFTVPPIA